MSYIITDYKNYVSRLNLGAYKAADTLRPLVKEFDGRRSASSAIFFDSIEGAIKYMNNNNLDSNAWFICKYDCCVNTIIKKIVVWS